jgi:hypothetical protein
MKNYLTALGVALTFAVPLVAEQLTTRFFSPNQLESGSVRATCAADRVDDPHTGEGDGPCSDHPGEHPQGDLAGE